jgi:hypothetical protein
VKTDVNVEFVDMEINTVDLLQNNYPENPKIM